MEEKSSTKTKPNTETISKLLPIHLTSCVVRGFGRGSKDLGIPTANICKENLKCRVSFDDLPCGIYWGFARVVHKAKEESDDSLVLKSLPLVKGIYKAAVSIGYNPVYGNEDKTIEPHLIAPSEHPSRKLSSCQETQFADFYGSDIRLSIVGYLRPELPFEGLDKLKDAIKNDIVETEQLAGESNIVNTEEGQWIESDEEV